MARKGKSYYNDDDRQQFCNRCGDRISTHDRTVQEVHHKVCSLCLPKVLNNIEARNGFHGYITHPAYFLTGEHGRERVDIQRFHRAVKNHRDDFWNVSKYFGGKF
jgi:hypothetical protein